MVFKTSPSYSSMEIIFHGFIVLARHCIWTVGLEMTCKHKTAMLLLYRVIVKTTAQLSAFQDIDG